MRIAIAGYGNLGRGTEAAILKNPDLSLAAVFTRRDPGTLRISSAGVPVYSISEAASHKNEIDVLIICGGSATDLPIMTPSLAADFNVVDSFDTHAKIPEHFTAVDAAARKSGHVAVISAGWDPGLFSLARLYMSAVLPDGHDTTFWGRGVSQGHSDAVRRIDGVLDARQYTIPVPAALEAVRLGQSAPLSARQKHTRECFVVAKEGADRERITREIVNMPDYFVDYDTTVTFIDSEEMKKSHSSLPHGGCVIRNGETSTGTRHIAEFLLKLDSNPEFTASVLCAVARAVGRFARAGDFGCKTLFDIPPAYLSPLDGATLRASML